MIKVLKRPVILTVSLLVIISLIYSISSSNSDMKGLKPINFAGNSGYTLQNQQEPSIEIGKDSGDDTVLEGDKSIPLDENENEIVPAKAVSEDAGLKDQSVAVKEVAEQEVAHKEVAEKEAVLGNFGELTDTPFMPKMANETLKAQLGNAAWRLFHTILARYPDKPTAQELATLGQYIHLFAQVYPCGDCARHFQGLLSKYPPQTSSRKTAALWGCFIHNQVNDRLDKPEYDCTTILEDYDCGCADDEQEVDATLGGKTITNLKGVEVQEEEEQLGG